MHVIPKWDAIYPVNLNKLLKIRLSRTGKKSQPSFKIVIQEHASAVKGKFIEEIGFYRPADNPKVFKVDLDRVKYWISVGAQPTDSMASLLKFHENLEGMDKYIGRRDLQHKKKKASDEPEEAPAAAAPAESSDAPAEETPKEEAPKEAPAAEEPAEEPKSE